MTKKQLNIVLIIIVLSLWGFVLYKYINRFFGSELMVYNENEFTIPIADIEKDTFRLNILSRDPFLGNVTSKNNKPQIKIKTLNKPFQKKEFIKINEPFPTIQYFGYIKSQEKNQKLILLKINNHLERIRLNDNINGLIVKKIYDDSIIVSYNKIEKSFLKIK